MEKVNIVAYVFNIGLISAYNHKFVKIFCRFWSGEYENETPTDFILTKHGSSWKIIFFYLYAHYVEFVIKNGKYATVVKCGLIKIMISIPLYISTFN